MAINMFLKIEGPQIKGESEDNKHKDEIEVLAWSWGASNSGSAQFGRGGGAGKVEAQDLSITKFVDKASTDLMQKTFDGKRINKATLFNRNGGARNGAEFFKIELEDIIVTSVSDGGSAGEDRLTENITFNFAKVKVIYVPVDEKGKKETEKQAGWDFAENKTTV